MKTLILILGTLSTISTYSQLANNANHTTRIYRADTSQSAYNQPQNNAKYTAGIYKTDSDYLSHHLTLGFNNKDTRGYKICIYSITDLTPENSSNIKYFSATLTSPIHYISRNNLIEVYHADTAFVNKVKHLPWTKSVDKWDHKHHNYKFVSWLD